jgi:hypothetical protein
MTYDFRASQVRTNKLIASGSTGTNASFLIYPFSSALNQSGSINTALFGTGSIGQDVFLFISGAISTLGTSTRGATVFGGDAKVSGSFHVLQSGAFSGPLSASVRTLYDGTPFMYGAAGIRITSQSNGSVAISGSTGIYGRLPLAGYVSTTNTSSNPQVAGQNAWSPTEWAYVSGGMGIYLKTILSIYDGAQFAYIKLYNISTAKYVEIGGPGVSAISSSDTTPTKFLSSDLASATNFSTNAEQIYELQLYTSTGSTPAVLGSAELLMIPN